MSEQKKAANIRYHYGKMRIRATYDADFKELLKTKVDWSAREWDADNREWVIDLRFRKSVMALMKEFFQPIHEENKPPEERKKKGKKKAKQAKTIPGMPINDLYAKLHLLPSAPLKLVDYAYKALAKLHHPDVNDEPNANEKMKEINLAYNSINDYIKKKG